MKKQEELFYVCVHDPVSLRRNLLLSSKALLDCLKTFELHNAVKNEKSKLFHDLKRVFDEILTLDRKLKSLLPKVKVPAYVKKEEVPKKIEKPKESEYVPKTKLDVLEEELSKVESKLSSLR